ncbi:MULTISPECIES: maleylpyruvate isomerase family mycothiol-dependent enzyme [Kitasatospora]|uniref:Putative mycothiol-dependent maleylpyruvate isomerase n=1 Tax=Kitasatospora setae (strain ATCC 33774 / DSM 43861 / JCM 3304 / KCC A-0304 / NBRC 14216 / KM-6054) TaxID=452652 RepID=E4NIH6_KITSK|nr:MULTISPECIES: maleylpyruvate isomerase family mycothiol-dependent enzyme [Kitasatospora]BAJ31306.1 putative mycothiol-dependent maleylpyruvate isomerase [Kitasatospora setae KM-6054]
MSDPTTGPTSPEAAAEAAAEQLRATAESTELLLHTLAELEPAAVGEPSALPGWTRGHVLAHLARNADSLVNLLTGARTGTDVPQYATPESRDADIEAGAGRPLAEQLADVRDSQRRFLAAAALLAPEDWTAPVTHRSGHVFPAWQIPAKRLAELEYHHVDLNAGYTPAHWPEPFAIAEFRRLGERFAAEPGLPGVLLVAEDAGLEARIGGGPAELTAEGPVRALTGWLSGRSNGDGLQVHRGDEGLVDPRAALPPLPPMG